ncbi:MAG: hypothetical protein Q8O67_20905 [Deltaproteobacteria bacterium]|nr:hypothetical protein [Deltaproteobacteria bacterium]
MRGLPGGGDAGQLRPLAPLVDVVARAAQLDIQPQTLIVDDAVDARFGRGDKKLFWDMLASDHVPFNSRKT